jgi:hypothetical protein
MTDRITQVIADFRNEALLPGHCGARELLMPEQSDYSGMWSGLCDRLPHCEQRFGFEHPVLCEVRAEMHRLADARPDAVKVFALATTRYGREQELGA